MLAASDKARLNSDQFARLLNHFIIFEPSKKALDWCTIFLSIDSSAITPSHEKHDQMVKCTHKCTSGISALGRWHFSQSPGLVHRSKAKHDIFKKSAPSTIILYRYIAVLHTSIKIFYFLKVRTLAELSSSFFLLFLIRNQELPLLLSNCKIPKFQSN